MSLTPPCKIAVTVLMQLVWVKVFVDAERVVDLTDTSEVIKIAGIGCVLIDTTVESDLAFVSHDVGWWRLSAIPHRLAFASVLATFAMVRPSDQSPLFCQK